MRNKTYKVILTEAQRDYLSELICKGTQSAQKLTRARILLKADEGEKGPAWRDQQIATALEISRLTVERVRKTFVSQGLERAISRQKPKQPTHVKFDGEKEAHLVAIACSDPPQGRERWTLRLVVERTFRSLGRYRRLSKDYERLTETSETMIYAAMVRLMLKHLA